MSHALLGKILMCEDLTDQETAIYHKFLEEKKRLDKLHKTTRAEDALASSSGLTSSRAARMTKESKKKKK